MKSLREILLDSEAYLRRHGIESARIEAEWLIGHALGLGRMDLYLQFDRPLAPAELNRIRSVLKRRAHSEPVQYICGATEFYNCSIQVGPGVLVPRPETERLVEIAVEQYAGCGAILDLCTGSGAILFALAKTLADPPAMTGTDLSTAALRWAGRNQEALGLDRIEFLEGDLYEPVHDRTFGLIIANPPYVSPDEYERLGEDIRNHEPREALVANDDGQAVLRRIAESATAHLVDGGVLICEIGETQSRRTIELFAAHGLRNPQVFQDYNDRDRVVVGRA